MIVPDEIRKLHDYGVTRIYSPEDGRKMGLEGMIGHLLQTSDYSVLENHRRWKISLQQTYTNSVRWQEPLVLLKIGQKTVSHLLDNG